MALFLLNGSKKSLVPDENETELFTPFAMIGPGLFLLRIEAAEAGSLVEASSSDDVLEDGDDSDSSEMELKSELDEEESVSRRARSRIARFMRQVILSFL